MQGPGAQGTWYRLHVSLELLKLPVQEWLITDAHVGESLGHFHFGPGMIVVADRGYVHPQRLVETHRAGAQWVVRVNTAVPLFDSDGQVLDVVAVLKQAQAAGPVQSVSCAAQVGPAGGAARRAGYLHAVPLAPEQAAAVRRRRRRQASKKGKTLKAKTL